MKVAYLILAHHNHEHLARLVRALMSPESYFHIHIDRKVNEYPFMEILPEQSNIKYLRQREKIYWGPRGLCYPGRNPPVLWIGTM